MSNASPATDLHVNPINHIHARSGGFLTYQLTNTGDSTTDSKTETQSPTASAGNPDEDMKAKKVCPSLSRHSIGRLFLPGKETTAMHRRGACD